MYSRSDGAVLANSPESTKMVAVHDQLRCRAPLLHVGKGLEYAVAVTVSSAHISRFFIVDAW